MVRTFLTSMKFYWANGQQKRPILCSALLPLNRKIQSFRPIQRTKVHRDPFCTDIYSKKVWDSYRCFHSRFSWFTQMNKEQQQDAGDLVAKKEKALQKALKNKFEQELESLERMQKYHFEMLRNWTADVAVMKIQTPRFNQIKEKTFQIHQDQIERTQEAIDVKRLLIIHNEKEDISKLLKGLEDIMAVESKYHNEQVQTIKQFINDISHMLHSVEMAYGKDSNDKNLELMRGFVHKHQKQLEEQILRHQEILQKFKKFLNPNVPET